MNRQSTIARSVEITMNIMILTIQRHTIVCEIECDVTKSFKRLLKVSIIQ